jgi:Domain of unknown function (DUF4136)
MRMKRRLCLGLAVFAILLGSRAALAQDSYDYKRDTNFAAIKTFAFKDAPPMAPDAYQTTTFDSPLVRERTHAAIAAQLEARGLRHTSRNPDVYIVTQRSYKVEVTYFPSYGWGYPYWGGYGCCGYYGGGDVYEQLRGTLTVDMVDAKSGALLWRGIETSNVHQDSKPAKRDKRVYKEVAEVFEHFPAHGAVATTGVRGRSSVTTGR